MKKGREESFIGDTSVKIYEVIKEWGNINHPVGGLIPIKKSEEWNKMKNRFEKYGVQMNKGGLMFAIKWTNTMMDAVCPIAEEIGYNPVGLTDDLVTMCAELVKGMDKKRLVEQSDILKKNVVQGAEDQILSNIKQKVTH